MLECFVKNTSNKNCSANCYVDNIKLYVRFPLQEAHIVTADMNNDRSRIRNWSFEIFSFLNPDKKVLIVYATRQLASKIFLNLRSS